VADFTRAKLEDAQRLASAEADSTPHAWNSSMYAGSLASEHDTIWLMQQDTVLLGAAVLMQVLDEAHLQNFFISSRPGSKVPAACFLRYAPATALPCSYTSAPALPSTAHARLTIANPMAAVKTPS